MMLRRWSTGDEDDCGIPRGGEEETGDAIERDGPRSDFEIGFSREDTNEEVVLGKWEFPFSFFENFLPLLPGGVETP